MTKLDNLPVIEHVVTEKPACAACKAFRPEVEAPTPEGGALPMCWLCAHHFVEHEVSLQDAPSARCECLPSEIYPAHSGMLKPSTWEKAVA